ncbi:hypothetical protein KAI46_00015 [bacterium]|nr:hypothetical protein [bacterium]
MKKHNLPDDIEKDLKNAAILHERAVSDYEKCLEFNKTMSNLLVKLEECENDKLADKVMGILVECNPKAGSHCDKATPVGNKMKTLGQWAIRNE